MAVANGKGGCGKTSVAVNLAGVAALSGWRVLLVDLDPQGNVGDDLGYRRHSDWGEALHDSVMKRGRIPLSPLRNVRPGLDVVPGGDFTEDLATLLQSRRSKATSHEAALGELLVLGEVLEAIADDYHLIVVDCPPAGGVLLDAALAAVRWLLIPTRRDAASLQGLVRVAKRFQEVASTVNPHLEVLGVVLFDFGFGHRRMVAEVRDSLSASLGSVAPVLESFVRSAPKASGDMRNAGQLAYEYEDAKVRATAEVKPWERGAARFGANAAGLAEDYKRLTDEVLQAVAGRLAATPGERHER
ncbi:MAG: ParA family protein [Acidimicrobiia bacterium]